MTTLVVVLFLVVAISLLLARPRAKLPDSGRLPVPSRRQQPGAMRPGSKPAAPPLTSPSYPGTRAPTLVVPPNEMVYVSERFFHLYGECPALKEEHAIVRLATLESVAGELHPCPWCRHKRYEQYRLSEKAGG